MVVCRHAVLAAAVYPPQCIWHWYTTNRAGLFHAPGDLDPAVIDRMDEALEFPLPSAPERKHIIALYLDQYISQAGTAAGGAGTAAVGLRARLSALLRGQKASADTIRSGDILAVWQNVIVKTEWQCTRFR